MSRTNISHSGPLSGLRVLDLTRVLSGPYASKWMASMGAEIIKIENPNDGDITRTYVPIVNGHSAYFPTFNHNKKCISLNLKSEKGKDIFKRLASTADVIMENFRPGVMDKLGLGYEALSKDNPRLIYASISGFGTYGPYSSLPGYDATAQAISGIMYLTGQADEAPSRVGSSIGDTVAGINCVTAILAALYCRERTGEGQMVETSLVDSLISLSASDYIRYFVSGEVPKRMGNNYKSWAPYGTYKAKDEYYTIGVGTEKHFCLLAALIGHGELIDDERFDSHAHRVEHRAELDSYINKWAADKTAAECCALLTAAGIPCGQVNSIVELSQDEHIAVARDMFPYLDQKEIGKYRITNIPIRFSKSGLVPLESAHDKGEDNDTVLGEIGFSPDEVDKLRQEGVV